MSVARLVAVAVLLLVACSRGDLMPGGDTPALDKVPRGAFQSTAVTEDGAPRPLVHGTVIEIEFEDRSERTVIRWVAGCNIFGAAVLITAAQLLVDEVSGTEMGCFGELGEQDAWLRQFFVSGPSWKLEDDRLTLISGETAIHLVAEAGPSGSGAGS